MIGCSEIINKLTNGGYHKICYARFTDSQQIQQTIKSMTKKIDTTASIGKLKSSGIFYIHECQIYIVVRNFLKKSVYPIEIINTLLLLRTEVKK